MQDQREPTPESPEQTFARRLRDLRASQGLTQDVLSERLAEHGWKLGPLTILRIEKNADGDSSAARRITLNDAVAIAAALNVDLQQMLHTKPPLFEQWEIIERQATEARLEVDIARHRAMEMESRLEEVRSRIRRYEDLKASRADRLTKMNEIINLLHWSEVALAESHRALDRFRKAKNQDLEDIAAAEQILEQNKRDLEQARAAYRAVMADVNSADREMVRLGEAQPKKD